MNKPKKNTVYGRSFTLLLPLNGIECWNHNNNAVGKFQVGETITVNHVYDATHTTITCAEKEGRPVFLDGKVMLWNGHEYGTEQGKPVMGYRFIAPNEALANAIGKKMPKHTIDIVGDIIAVESGTGTQVQARRVASVLQGTSIGDKFKRRYVH